MTKIDVTTAKGLGEFNTHLADKSYVEGYVPTSRDSETFKAFGAAPASTTPHVLRWYNHIKSFEEYERYSWVHVAAPVEVVEEKKKDDAFDLFGEEDADEEAIREAEIQKRADEQAAKKKAQLEASGKGPVVMKSLVILDVKPWEDTTDLVEMEKLVRAIEMEGLEWKASKLVPIGYGIKKLQISCHVIDENVSVDDIQERIAEFEEFVQSTDVVAFSKL